MCSSRSALVCGGLTPPSLSRLVKQGPAGVSVSAIYAAVATAAGAGIGLRWRDLIDQVAQTGQDNFGDRHDAGM